VFLRLTHHQDNPYFAPSILGISILSRSSWYQRDALWQTAVVAAPIVAFTLIILWFSRNPISPGPAVEASITNPAGFITSNFVYDGSINIENIVASSAFVLLVCAYYPRDLRFFFACLLPFAAVGAGALAELTTVSTTYVNLPFCSGSCSFYGMSGVASGMIGFAVASFLIALGIFVLQLRGTLAVKNEGAIFGNGRTGLAVLLSMFAVYVVLLLFFSGLITLPAAISGSHPPGGVSSGPPPAILTQTPPVALVHSASLVYGFLLCLAVFVRVNRRYHILVLPTRG
jgi:hypothetical protein